MKKVDKIVLESDEIERGTEVRVTPSAPGMRDGFKAKFISARVDEDGKIIEITVFGSPGTVVDAMRTYPAKRIRKIVVKNRRPRRDPIENRPPQKKKNPKKRSAPQTKRRSD